MYCDSGGRVNEQNAHFSQLGTSHKITILGSKVTAREFNLLGISHYSDAGRWSILAGQ